MLCQYSAVSAAPRAVLEFIVYSTANLPVYVLKYQSLTLTWIIYTNLELNQLYQLELIVWLPNS